MIIYINIGDLFHGKWFYINMNIGYIYKITCLINNKIYVGSKLSKTFVESYWSSSLNNDYWNDLKQYGKENFKREILCWCKTKKELREKEKQYIILENALTSKGGYNQALGANTIIFTENIKDKMKMSAKLRWQSLTEKEKQLYSELHKKIALDPKGKMQSKEYKEKMSKICTGRRTYNNGKIQIITKGTPPKGFVLGSLNPSPLIGTKRSKEICKKLSEIRMGKVANKKWWTNGKQQKFCEQCPGKEWYNGRLNANWNKARKKHHCKCIETGLYFKSIMEAVKWLNIPNMEISTVYYYINECCKHNKENAFNYHWEYVE